MPNELVHILYFNFSWSCHYRNIISILLFFTFILTNRITCSFCGTGAISFQSSTFEFRGFAFDDWFFSPILMVLVCPRQSYDCEYLHSLCENHNQWHYLLKSLELSMHSYSTTCPLQISFSLNLVMSHPPYVPSTQELWRTIIPKLSIQFIVIWVLS